MKPASFAVAAFVALSLIGGASNSNPVQTETAGAALNKSAVGEPALTDDRGGRENRVEETNLATNQRHQLSPTDDIRRPETKADAHRASAFCFQLIASIR
jgi:hypothetical protein